MKKKTSCIETNLNFESQHFDDLTVKHFTIIFSIAKDIIIVDQCDITFIIWIFRGAAIMVVITINTNGAPVQRFDSIIIVDIIVWIAGCNGSSSIRTAMTTATTDHRAHRHRIQCRLRFINRCRRSHKPHRRLFFQLFINFVLGNSCSYKLPIYHNPKWLNQQNKRWRKIKNNKLVLKCTCSTVCCRWSKRVAKIPIYNINFHIFPSSKWFYSASVALFLSKFCSKMVIQYAFYGTKNYFCRFRPALLLLCTLLWTIFQQFS